MATRKEAGGGGHSLLWCGFGTAVAALVVAAILVSGGGSAGPTVVVTGAPLSAIADREDEKRSPAEALVNRAAAAAAAADATPQLQQSAPLSSSKHRDKPKPGYFVQAPRVQCGLRSSASLSKSSVSKKNIDELASVECPPFKLNENNDDAQQDRKSSWVVAKYKYYASRCNKTSGVMWSQLTKRAHDRVVDRVLELYGMSVKPSEPYPPMLGYSLLGRSTGGDGGAGAQTLALLDWACGCGVTLNYLDSRVGPLLTPVREHRHSAATANAKTQFVGIGIDLTSGAIDYAQSTFMTPEAVKQRRAEGRAISFCHADGTDLSWLPPASFDVITAFGGLLHLPAKYMCSTLQRLVSLLKPGGMLWAGYIDNVETRAMLTACQFSCEGDEEVVVSVLDENRWWKGVGIPSANKKLKPTSIVWERKAKTRVQS